MIAPINISPPKNWQDFEVLCLRLWGEIWNIPHEIELNSDNSQGQQGVDIYGPINSGLQYYGIQCKNKKLNLINGVPNRISVQDILTEIEKAKLFKPALTKLIIATSLSKDQKVEEFVRIKNVENLQNGLFSIQICFWEYFERKIPEYQKVYDWYLKNENYHRVRDVSVLFENGTKSLIYNPKYLKTVDRYVANQQKETDDELAMAKILGPSLSKILRQQKEQDLLFSTTISQRIPWEQSCWFNLFIKNKGQAVIEDYKIELDFEGDFIEVGAEKGNPIFNSGFSTNVKEYSNTNRSLWIRPSNNILVQNDSIITGDIRLKPTIAKASIVKIYWKLLSRDFEESGTLEIEIKPLFHKKYFTHHVDSEDEETTTVDISLIQRRGSWQTLSGANFFDNESDYIFEE